MALRRVFLCVLVFLALMVACAKQEPASTSSAETDKKDAATGAVTTSIWYVTPDGAQIAVRDYQVELRAGKTVVKRATSDAFGIVRFRGVPAGTYVICTNPLWSTSWSAQCWPGEIKVDRRTTGAGELHATADPAKGGVVYGNVRFADGVAAVAIDPLFAVASYPKITLNTGASAQANADSAFVIAGVSADAKSIDVHLENMSANAPITAGGATVVTLPNHVPRAASQVLQAKPGEMVALKNVATDADHDALAVHWNVNNASVASSADGSTQWKAPQKPGRYRAYSLSSDGKGGYVRTAFVVNVLPTGGQPCPNPTNTFTCPPTGAPAVACEQGNKFLTIHSNDVPTADAYYLAADPNGKRKTLKDWWLVAGFNADGTGGTRASYTNDNDLGFGRDMHMIQTPNGTFGYVTNFANQCRLQDAANARLATTADPHDAVATVCMEFAAPNYDGPQSPGSGTAIVKFFVYDDQGNRATQAALDPKGVVPIPNLCLNCHGGNDFVTQTGKIDLKARFLPFDLATFKYEPPNTPDLKAFHALNNLVNGTMTGAPINDLIAGWYRAGGDTPDPNYVPANDWSSSAGKQKLYQRVVGRSCRTCHYAFDQTGGPIWDTYAEFKSFKGSIKSDIGIGRMPHAEITFMNLWSTNFWPDTSGVAALKCFTDSPDDATMETCLAAIP